VSAGPQPYRDFQSLLGGRQRTGFLQFAPRRFRNARLLLPVDLDQRQPGVTGDDLKDGVG